MEIKSIISEVLLQGECLVKEWRQARVAYKLANLKGFDFAITYDDDKLSFIVFDKFPSIKKGGASSKKFVYIEMYLDQMVLNKDDFNRHLERGWMLVPRDWATEQAQEQGYKTLQEFLSDYTYDTVEGWFDKAMKEGVLAGAGVGRLPVINGVKAPDIV